VRRCGGAGEGGTMPLPSWPEWRNWQTRETQNLVGFTARVGSIPSSGTNSSGKSRNSLPALDAFSADRTTVYPRVYPSRCRSSRRPHATPPNRRWRTAGRSRLSCVPPSPCRPTVKSPSARSSERPFVGSHAGDDRQRRQAVTRAQRINSSECSVWIPQDFSVAAHNVHDRMEPAAPARATSWLAGPRCSAPTLQPPTPAFLPHAGCRRCRRIALPLGGQQ
jgi:hypothetical protein